MNYAIVLSGETGIRTGADMPKQYVRVNGHIMRYDPFHLHP